MATGRQVNIENYDVGRALGQASGKPGLILALALTFGVTLDKSPDFPKWGIMISIPAPCQRCCKNENDETKI